VTIRTGIPGADELVGKGVYRGMPKNVPQPVRNRHAVVVGAAAECAAAARQLRQAGWRVTVVTREKCCRRDVHGECSRRVATELVCATGIEYLEALVLRRIGRRRIEAFDASALFILRPLI
jgi:thioredoxin reductase